MGLKELILQLSERLCRQKNEALTEEATKISFILPFLKSLGYDIFNPSEVRPEADCDYGSRKDNKIDFIVSIDKTPAILIECKHWTENLCNHIHQLARYYPASDARVAVLTNGVQYYIFADLNKINIMDKEPFYTFDISNMSDDDIEIINMLSKENFNEQAIISKARDIMDYNIIYETLQKELSDPSTEFVRFMYRKSIRSTESISGNKLCHFKDVLQRAIKSVMDNNCTETNEKGGIADNELHSILDRVISTMTNGVPDKDYIIRHFKTYSTVSFKRPYLWFVRVYYNGWDKCYISFLNSLEGKGEANKTKISCISDIDNLKPQMQQSLKSVKLWIQSHSKN